MKDFKKSFSRDQKPGGFSRGGMSRPSFGGPRRSDSRDSGPSETYKATCSKCHDACEVPFRPNGKKPVFCRNCFVRDDARPTGNTYEKRSYAPERSFEKPSAPVEDPRIGVMQRDLQTINAKLDQLIASLEGAAYSSILTTSKERAEKPEKKAAAKPAKKVAKKKA